MTDLDPRELVLGVDVGNSKTHVAIADLSGEIIAAGAGSGVISGRHDDESLLPHVLDLVERLIGVRGGFAAAALTIAGLDLEAQETAMRARADAAAIALRTSVVNDVFAVLRAGGRGADGVAVVVGAGINCVAVRGDSVVRFLAGGRISGDWGGGIDVGTEALALACRGEDGRGERTTLGRLLSAHFGLADALATAEAVMAGQLAEHRLTELAPVVFSAAVDGDTVARGIVERLADEVAFFIRAAVTRLDGASRTGSGIPVVLGGGLMRARNPLVHERIERTLGPLARDLAIGVQDAPPVVGSLLLAFDLLPETISEATPVSAQRLGRDLARHL